jgi:hypothetical protein
MPFLALTVLLALEGATPTPSAPPGPEVPTGPSVVLDRIATVVGDEIVLESEIGRLVALELVPRLPGESDATYRDRVLNGRIDELVWERKLHSTGGVDPDPREVEARIQELAARLKAAGEDLDSRLARLGISREDLKGWVRRGLALATYAKERISPTVKITDAELNVYYEGPFRAEALQKGLPRLPPFAEVQDQLRDLVRERKLNEAIQRWTADLRADTRILIYRRPPLSAALPPAAGGTGGTEARR